MNLLNSPFASIWPPDNLTLFIGYLIALTAMISVNAAPLILDKFRPNSRIPLRTGFLRPIFYLVLLSHIVLALPLSLIFLYTLCGQGRLPIPTVLLTTVLHATFWILTALRFWKNRHQHDLPLSMVFSYAIACFLLAFPMILWHRAFPEGINEPYFAPYVIEAIIAFFILFSILFKDTLKRDEESTFTKFFEKIVEIWPYIWPKKSLRLQLTVLFCLLLLAVGRVINVLVPLYSKWIVDALSGPNPSFCWPLILAATGLKFLQGSGAMGGLLNTVRSFLWLPIQQYTTLEIEVDLLRHLHSLSLRWHLSRRTGEILRVMDKGVDSINTLLNYVLFNVLPSMLDILLASIFFFTTFHVYFGFLVLLTMSVYLAATIIISEWRVEHRREMNECDKQAGAIGVDSLINYETIKHYNAEELETQRYKEAYQIYQKAESKANLSLSLLNSCQNAIIGFGLISGSLLAAYMIAHHAGTRMMSAGDYVLFTTYLLQLYGPLNFFGTIYRTIQRSFIDMENMQKLFKEEIEIKDAPDAVDLDAFPGRIEFRNVSFSYTPEKPVLQDLTFTVNPGETVALVGPSGSGKTTVIRLLFRLYDVTGGQILFNGTDISMLKLKSLRDKIGIVPQDTVLFNDTIRYNIRYGRPSASDAEIEEAAKAAAIHQFIISHPDGYNCLVGERGLKLSGGEKQRVAIARAILKRPEYILLDEATSALDSRTERSIQQNLFELCRRRTCVVVAHRLSTVVHADKILVLKEGKVVESGTHDQLLEQNGLYAEMWRLQNERPTMEKNEENSNSD